MQYQESFYQDVIKRNNGHLNKFAYCKGVVIGALCSRIEPYKQPCQGPKPSRVSSVQKDDSVVERPLGEENNGQVVGVVDSRVPRQRLYIMTLAVLAPYRGRGTGRKLLQSALDYCRRQLSSVVDQVALHVQISNTDAIRFYTRHFDFCKGEMVRNYYKRIQPPHCYMLYKHLSMPKNDEKEPAETNNQKNIMVKSLSL